ncbi:hypothetical protein ACHLDN_002777 [Escherichia coli]|nr:hypothetical protein [Escherichia coli]EEV3484664.1 hypothetical protein [Escherichia coli]EEZ1866355.1 hypothetical protein [Escherichia coli]EFK9901149.1 hypothetical protein [Escherichia coli]EJP7013288.1 hypothetical protein [Escherichia coli]
MTALSFRQVRDRLNLSSDDDLLSLIARVPQWKDGELWLSPNRWCYPPGEPLTLSLAGERYISDALPDGVRCWVKREDFRYAGRDPLTTTPYSKACWAWSEDGPTALFLEPSSCAMPEHYHATTSQVITSAPPTVWLTACGWFNICRVIIEDSATLHLVPSGASADCELPLYLQLPFPMPEALTNSMTIRGSGFHILKELLTSSTSDAKQLHDANTTAADQPPAKRNTTPAEANATPAATDNFFGPRHKPAGRVALAVLVGLVIGVPQPDYAVPLRKVYDELKPGGIFRGVIDGWLRALPPEMQDNAARITGIHAGDWTAYDNAPDSEDGIMGMVWLCLAYLEGLPEAHTTGKKPAKNVRRAYAHIEKAYKELDTCRAAVSNTAVGDWFEKWTKRRSELKEKGESKTILWDK